MTRVLSFFAIRVIQYGVWTGVFLVFLGVIISILCRPRLGMLVRRQEAALRRLEAKHGSGYGKPPPGSESEARAKRYNENCMR